MKSYVVIGLGRFGQTLARQLCMLGAEVLAMDVSNDLVQQVAEEVTHAVVGDAQDKDVLRALGVRDFDCAIVAIGSNLAASVLAVMNLIPEQENAARLARSLNSHNVLDYIELSEEYGILEIPAPRSWIGKTLKELNIRAKLGVNIIAVESGKKTNVSPSADYQIREGDIMVVLGDTYSLEAVQKL